MNYNYKKLQNILQMETEPIATIKITFDELPPNVLSLLYVMYTLLIISNIYLSIKIADLLVLRLHNLFFYRIHRRILENDRID